MTKQTRPSWADPPTHATAAEFRAAFPRESEQVEFKQGVSSSKIAEAVAGFSNGSGGVVWVGVGPDGRLVGTNTDGEALARLHRIVATVRDPGRYSVITSEVEGRSLLALAVHPRREGYAQLPDGRVLARRGAMNAPLLGADLVEFLQARALTRFEATKVAVALDRASAERRRQLSAAWGWRGDDRERLIEHRLAVTDGGGTWMTVAGALYLLDDPATELGKAYVEIFRYRDDGALEDRREEIRGPLNDQVERATKWIVDELGRDQVILGTHRIELDRLPVEVLRETIANAVAHRVYEDARRPVRIEVRPTSVRVISPGPLPEPVTVTNMREQNAARNVEVIATLRRFRLAEDAGRGVDLIQDSMARQLLDAPIFEDDGTSVSVTLPLTSVVSIRERAWITEIEAAGDIRREDRLLLLQAARGAELTNRSVRRLTGWDSVEARASLRRLSEAGLLIRDGERSGARYRLAPGMNLPGAATAGPADLEAQVLRLAEAGPIANEQVRAVTGLDRPQALALLKRLVEQGRLETYGQRRGTRYVLPGGAS